MKNNIQNELFRAAGFCGSDNNADNELRKAVEAGADVNQRDWHGKSVLDILCRRSGDDQLENIKYILDNGADVNSQDSCQNTALFLAFWTHNFETCKLLIEKGADIYIKNNVGKTVFDRPYTDSWDPDSVNALKKLFMERQIAKNQAENADKQSTDYPNYKWEI